VLNKQCELLTLTVDISQKTKEHPLVLSEIDIELSFLDDDNMVRCDVAVVLSTGKFVNVVSVVDIFDLYKIHSHGYNYAFKLLGFHKNDDYRKLILTKKRTSFLLKDYKRRLLASMDEDSSLLSQINNIFVQKELEQIKRGDSTLMVNAVNCLCWENEKAFSDDDSKRKITIAKKRLGIQ
jgi:hypothetical protein